MLMAGNVEKRRCIADPVANRLYLYVAGARRQPRLARINNGSPLCACAWECGGGPPLSGPLRTTNSETKRNTTAYVRVTRSESARALAHSKRLLWEPSPRRTIAL